MFTEILRLPTTSYYAYYVGFCKVAFFGGNWDPSWQCLGHTFGFVLRGHSCQYQETMCGTMIEPSLAAYSTLTIVLSVQPHLLLISVDQIENISYEFLKNAHIKISKYLSKYMQDSLKNKITKYLILDYYSLVSFSQENTISEATLLHNRK